MQQPSGLPHADGAHAGQRWYEVANRDRLHGHQNVPIPLQADYAHVESSRRPP